MPYIKFDRRGPAKVINDHRGGLTLVRGVQIYDPTIVHLSGTASDPSVLLRCLSMVGSGPGDYVTRFPQMFDGYPDDDFNFCTVINQNITGLDRSHRLIEADITYHSPFGPEGPGESINYIVTDSSQQGVVRAFTTAPAVADGLRRTLSGWFLEGYDNQEAWDSSMGGPPIVSSEDTPVASVLPTPAQKIVSTRVIEAVGSATVDQWDSVKETIRGMRGKINSDTSGDWAPRGTWLFLGPTTRRASNAQRLDVHLVFLEAIGVTRWYAMLPFFNRYGDHPASSATESDALVANSHLWEPDPPFPPPQGQILRINGLSIASIQEEAEFAPVFTFSPV